MAYKVFPQKVMERLAYTTYGEVTINGAWNEEKEDFEPDLVLEVLHNEQCDTTRWNSVHDLVFVDKATGEAYHTRYEQGLTESQMLEPFYYDRDGVECDIVRVWKEEVTYTETKWERK